jgi:hypothetical protein
LDCTTTLLLAAGFLIWYHMVDSFTSYNIESCSRFEFLPLPWA